MSIGSGIGQAYADMFVTMVMLAFGAGIVCVGIIWLLWHFVLSHLRFGWA